MAKKFKGLNKAIEEFNSWPGTARIYADLQANRVWTETFVLPHEGRFAALKPFVREIHSKEIQPYAEGVPQITEELLLEKIEIEREECDFRKKKNLY